MKAYYVGAVLGATLCLVACKSDKKGGGDEGGALTGSTCPDDSSLTYDDDIKPMMAKYCTKCHATSVPDADRNGAPSDHNFESEDGVTQEAHHIDIEAAAGPDSTNTAMPPSGYPAPSLAERKKLGEWLACNADVATDDDD